MTKAFDFLEPYAALIRSARKALSYAADDPNHALIEVRKFGERLTERLANAATPPVPQGTTYERQAALRDRGVLPSDIFAALDRCRRTGNEAVHGDQSDARLVWRLLQDVHDIASWFVQLEGHPAPGPFVPDAHGTPLDAAEQERQLRERLSIDLRVPMSGFAARGRMEARDVDSLFVPPSFTDEPRSWSQLVEGTHAGRRVVIGGAGGSGKSTLCRALARALLDEPNGPIPLLLPLAAVDDSLRGAIVRRVRDHLYVRLDGDVLESWLESGRAVLILDGLDEARDPVELARAIEAMASAYKGLAVVVTGRPHMLSRLPIRSFQETWIKDWQSWQAEWFLARLLDAASAEKIIVSIWRSAGLAGLLRSPLMTTLLAMVWRERGALPEGRGALLDAAIRTMLETWPERRNRRDREIPLTEQVTALERLAHATLSQDFDSSFAGFVRALGWGLRGERWLEHIIDETGILRAIGRDRYVFFHYSVRNHLAAAELLRGGLDVVSFVISNATGSTTNELSLDLVEAVGDRPGLANELLVGLRDLELPSRGAWFGASRAWWLGHFRDFVRNGLVLDEATIAALLQFVAEDRLRVYRAVNANEPMRFGDEDETARMMQIDVLRTFGKDHFLSDPPSMIVSEAKIDAWLRSNLQREQGEALCAVVAFALERLDEDEILRLVGDRYEGLFWLWPRSPAGRLIADDEGRGREARWPGEGLAQAAGAGISLEAALEEWSDASDWLGRALSLIYGGGGRGLHEATVVLILRQTLSVGFRGVWSAPETPLVMHSGPLPCVHLLIPRLGVAPMPGLGGAHERYRGPVWLGWRDQALAQLVHLTGMRTPLEPMTDQEKLPWPDTTELDALPMMEVPRALEVQSRLVKQMGLLNPTVFLINFEQGTLRPLMDAVPLILHLGAEGARPAWERPDQVDLRQTWLAEMIVASLVTRGMPEAERLCHLQQRLQCRATSNLWSAFERRALSSSDPVGRELLLPAMLWAQRSLTGGHPVTPWVEQFFASPQAGWLARVFQALCVLGQPGVARHMRRQARRQLKLEVEGAGDHPAAAILRAALGQT